MNRPKFFKAFSLTLCLSLISLTFAPLAFAEDSVISTQDSTTTTLTAEVDSEILPTSFWYNITKFSEFVQLNLLTFNDDSKVELLEEFTDQRVDEMEYAETVDDYEAIDLCLERYEAQKTDSLEYIEDSEDETLIEEVKLNTLEQQKLMTNVQINLSNSGETQNNMVQVQTKTATQTKNMVQATQGEQEANQYHDQTRVVWMDPNADENGNLPELPESMENWEYAPGTSDRNASGVVIEYSEGVESNGINGSGNGESGNVVNNTDGTTTDGNGNTVVENDETGNNSGNTGNAGTSGNTVDTDNGNGGSSGSSNGNGGN